MTYTFSTAGALIGMALAIFLIIRKFHPAYSLIIGALVGGLIGSGGNLGVTVDSMMTGAGSMITSVLRIMTSGILAGALIRTGSAEKIAQVIVRKLGSRRALFAVALATMIICAVGVFIDDLGIGIDPQNRVAHFHEFERCGRPETPQPDDGKLCHFVFESLGFYGNSS